MDMTMGVEELRSQLGKRVEAAQIADDITIVTKGNRQEPHAVLVPYEWYRQTEARRRALLKEKP
jgi:hypothetical protein